METQLKHILLAIAIATALAGCGGSTDTEAPAAEIADVVEEAAPVAEATAEEAAADTGPAGVPAPEGAVRVFEILPDASEASYTVGEEFFEGASRIGRLAGLAEAVGTTSAVKGQFSVVLGPEPQIVDGRFSVDISTLQSDDERRDDKIREQWLESLSYPVAAFEATDLSGFPADYSDGQEVSFQLEGVLSIREVGRPVTFDVTAMLDRGVLEGEATTTVQMTDFGFEPPSFLGVFNVENDVLLKLAFTAQEL